MPSLEVPTMDAADLAQRHRSMRISTAEGCVTSIFLAWCGGAFITGYMRMLGAEDADFAHIASVPLLGQLLTPFASWLLTKRPSPRLLCALTGGIGRGIWIFAVLLPILALSHVQKVQAMIILVLISSVFQSTTGVLWLTWMGEIVPPGERGRYFGVRNGICGVVAMIAGLGAGMFLDRVPEPLNYQILYSVGICFAAAGIYLYLQKHEPKIHRVKMSLKDTVRIPLKDENFRRFLKFAAYWQASVLLGSTFVFPFFITVCHYSFTDLAIWQVLQSSTTMLVGPLWGRIADKAGNKSILKITTFFAGSLLPLSWIMCVPDDPTVLYMSAIIDGIVWSAINPSIQNLAFGTAPERVRVAYISVLSVVNGTCGFLSGMFSALLLTGLQHLEFTAVAGFTWTRFHWLFLISGFLRASAFMLLASIREEKSWKTRDVIRAMLQWRNAGNPH